jgi:predicted dienelactone hydrolase
MMNSRKILLALVTLAGISPSVRAADYDPLSVGKATPEHSDFTVKDEKRSREIPIRVYLPQEKAPAAVVLFSPGLGGTREGYAYLGNHWALRDYAVVVLQHPGSDDSVWKDKPVAERMAAMEQAASLENFMLRARDVPAVIDQLDAWNKDKSHTLAGRLDLARLGMAGHSFGAVTTQAVSGQTIALRGRSLTDARIKAAVVMSPSGPRRFDAKRAFGTVTIPWLLMTGTKDVAPIGDISLESRLSVFPVLPPGGKYEIVLDRAEHSAFSDRALPGDSQQRNPNHHRAILALSTAFWDAYLRDDADAKQWLDGEAARKVLESGDKWQKK